MKCFCLPILISRTGSGSFYETPSRIKCFLLLLISFFSHLILLRFFLDLNLLVSNLRIPVLLCHFFQVPISESFWGIQNILPTPYMPVIMSRYPF